MLHRTLEYGDETENNKEGKHPNAERSHVTSDEHWSRYSSFFVFEIFVNLVCGQIAVHLRMKGGRVDL